MSRFNLQQSEKESVFANIVGKSAMMQEKFRLIEKVAPSNCSILLQGESGTGKELVARAIHHNSPRKQRTFVPVNCAALPDDLLESELFGYEKGAFTGADSKRLGKFETAQKGTIFLDEIADMSLSMQAKILRVIQEQSFDRVGGTKPVKVDFRLITATNKNLEKAIIEGLFRDDLYYRLNVIVISLPPLRERKEDIPLLANYFLKRYNGMNGEKVKTIPAEVLDLLVDYEWPGNVRELENVIERAVVLSNDNIILPENILLRSRENSLDPKASSPPIIPLIEAEKALIRKALEATSWNQSKAAKLLRIHRNTLRRKIRRFKLA